MSVWGQLPLELVVAIIKQTDKNDYAATNWCLATEGNSFLHKEALARRWRNTYIGGCDFMAAPGEYRDGGTTSMSETVEYEADEIEAMPQIVECGKLAKANQDPQSKINQAIRAGIHIRHLYLDLRPRGLEQPYKYPDGYKGTIHTYDTAKYSAKSLLTSLTDLEALTLDGCVTDQILEFVPSCRSLTVRVHLTGDEYRLSGASATNAELGPPLSWGLRLSNLVNFTLNELTFEEASPLANFIESLVSLKHLCIKVRFQFEQLRAHFSDTEPRGPMAALLDYVPPGRETPLRGNLLCRLPSSLESLTLIDNYFLRDVCLSISTPPTDHTLSTISLTSLTTQFDHLPSTPNLLTWMPQSRLRRLSLLTTTKSPEKDPIEAINSIIHPHESTLQEIQLTNAWRTHYSFCSSFNTRWASQFAITELNVGLLDSGRREYDPARLPVGDSLSVALYGWSALTGNESGRWGDQLLRVRLENVNLEKAKVEGIDDENLSKLRVLIVTPRGRGFEKHYPAPIGSFKEGRLALDIAKLALPSLRYLSVGLDVFWIDHPTRPGSGSNDEEERSPRLRHYADADCEDRAEMQKWFTKEDRDFIDPNSRLNAPRKDRVFVADEPDYWLVVNWNYMVARRVDENGQEISEET